MELWNVVLLFVLLVGLVAFQLYKRENEGFIGAIRQKMRPLLRKMRHKREAMSKNVGHKWDMFKRKHL